MNTETTLKSNNLEADIVIVGGGGAGLASAVAAAELKASVIVLEKRRVLGGNANIIEAITASESPVQKRDGFDVTNDYLFEKSMAYCRWDCNPRVVRALINKSGDTIRWLEEKGIRFNLHPIWPSQDPNNWHEVIGPGTETAWLSGSGELTRVLVKNCEELGVKLLCETSAKKILTGTGGKVTGVLAATEDGKELEVKAKSVIIATGGYAANKEMLKKHPYYHESMVSRGLPHEGDGIRMTTEIGADTEGIGEMALVGPCPPASRHKASITLNTGDVTQQVSLIAVVQEACTIWVNKQGKRFCDEGFSFNHYDTSIPILRQPEMLSFTLFDTDILKGMIKNGFYVGLSLCGEGWARQRAGNLIGLESELRRLADTTDLVKIADSWDEIAQWMGAKPEVLKATIDEYNAACEQGYDPDFLKDRRWLQTMTSPPYYALRATVGILHTCGGIKIDEHMQVIDKQGNPIPGLYAAGDETGGWEKVAPSYHLSGVGIALPGGRIAAENAVKYSS